eukprot:11380706-Ditylum_brightwellii.AAC.1
MRIPELKSDDNSAIPLLQTLSCTALASQCANYRHCTAINFGMVVLSLLRKCSNKNKHGR